MANTAKSRKAKGTKLEQLVAAMLVDSQLDPYAKRMVLSGAVKGFDGDIKTSLPTHWEVKNHESWDLTTFYNQCSMSNPEPARKMNIVVVSRNRLPEPYAFLKVADLVELMGYAKMGGWGK